MIPFLNKVKSQVMHKIYMLSKVRKYLTLEASITIFKSMLLPFFEYGSIFLEPCPDKLKSKLDRLYLRGIRLALRNYDNVDEGVLLDKISLLSLRDRREICIGKLIFNKIAKNKLEVQNPTVNTRIHDGRVLPWPDVSNDKFKLFIPHLGPTIWNKLSSDLRNIDNILEFKNSIKKFYKEKQK